MRYWRLFFVSFLLTFSIAGCHRKVERVLPPPQAQAPMVSTLPAMPPLDLEPVILAGATPAPAAPPPVEAPPPKKHVAKVHHRRTPAKAETEGASTETQPATGTATAPVATAPGTAVIGQLSADDATATPSDAAQTQHLIDATEKKLKKLSTGQQTEHKDAVAQVDSFLTQARQALSMNDVVGAQTLANKAKILVDELSK
ncbi:MAG: hypothetical protein WCE63_14745 [Acidobacteriaceae bacterium]